MSPVNTHLLEPADPPAGGGGRGRGPHPARVRAAPEGPGPRRLRRRLRAVAPAGDPLPGRGRPAVRRAAPVDPGLGHQLPRRDRRPLAVARDPDHVPDAPLPPRLLDLDREAGAGVRGLHAAARGGDDRGLRGPGPLPLLRVLGGDAHPDVLPHRDLGARPPHLRRGQVLPLHVRGQRADAGGLPGPLHERRDLELRHPEAGRLTPSSGAPDLALPGLRPRLRDQGADVALPHLAARRARRGPDRGLGDPRRRAAEDGGLRLPPARDPALPGRGHALRAAGGRPGGHRHRLRRPRLAGPARPEEARRLLLGVPPRLRRCSASPPSPPRASWARSTRCSTTASPRARSSSSSACSTTGATRASSPSSAGCARWCPGTSRCSC